MLLWILLAFLHMLLADSTGEVVHFDNGVLRGTT